MRLMMIFLCCCLFASAPASAQCTNPQGTVGELMFSQDYDVFQGCTARGWIALHAYTIPPDCPNIGDSCLDGTIYAGLSPAGNVRMYTTASVSSTAEWGGSGVDTAMMNCVAPYTDLSCNDGRANTTFLAALPTIYSAARYCEQLVVHGKEDWYLPARNELNILYENRAAIGNFTNSWYWSSSEYNGMIAWNQNFANGAFGLNGKGSGPRSRCVRR